MPFDRRVREKELRLALVCFGGISLAVYMHGVSKEILKLDVIAGASAGGINGAMLARALAHDLPVGHLRDMWLESGDVDELLAGTRRARRWSKPFMSPFMSPFVWALGWTSRSRTVRDNEVRHKLSLFVRSRWFKPPLDGTKMSSLMYKAVDRMGDAAESGRSLLPSGLGLDLFVTVTAFYGYQQLIQIHEPAVIREREHRHVRHFTYRRSSNGDVQSDFLRDNAPGLAFAARATSAYPGAFPPAQLREIDQMLAAEGRSWSRREHFLRKCFRRYYRAGLDPDATSFIDGSVLNNQPFAEALDAIRSRPAYRQVDRRLVYIDPDPVQPAPPPGGRTPGFFATLKGALSDLPRNEPIAEQLESIADFNERVRQLRTIVDPARPEIARLVIGLAEAPIDEPLTAGALAAWRKAANERAAHDAGFAYQGYVRQKLESVKAYLARLIASICSLRHRSSEAAWIEFLHAFDVEFRKRRLVFMIQGQNSLYAKLSAGAAEARRSIDALKRKLYQCLDRLRRYESVEFRSSVTCGELGELFGTPPTTAQMAALDDYAVEFAAKNEHVLTLLVERLAADISRDEATEELDVLLAGVDLTHWSLDAWREVLVNYVGFPFWDVLTLPLTGWRDLGEFDEIRVDRISPEDAPTLARLADPPELRGTAFLHFGAFFSRAFRDNDYLLGRLQAIDRLDSAGAAAIVGIDVAALKRRAFEVVLRSEEACLPNAQGLIERLRAKLVSLHPT